MNIVDIAILAWLVFSILRGYHIGLIRQAASFAGFVLGILAGAWAAPIFFGGSDDTGSKIGVVLILVVGLGLVGAALAEMLALKLQRQVHLNLAHTINAILGGVFSAITTLFLAWILLLAINRLPLAGIGLSISESQIYRGMEQNLPTTPSVLGRLSQIITPYGFPQIFVGSEPEAAPVTTPTSADVEAAAVKARNAVVRIEGYGCGDISTGSGFIAAPGLIITNAHVIAGVGEPVVVRGGDKFRSVPVWFDEKLDVAILRVQGLEAPVLPLADSATPSGQSGAVLGYPSGGPLTVVSGVMQRRYAAVGRDIYGRGLITREIYEVQAEIHPGNSGGPFVLPDGTVAGVMFGASRSQATVSYAITSAAITGMLRQAVSSNDPTSTGACL